jgi:hypothetical protein
MRYHLVTCNGLFVRQLSAKGLLASWRSRNALLSEVRWEEISDRKGLLALDLQSIEGWEYASFIDNKTEAETNVDSTAIGSFTLIANRVTKTVKIRRRGKYLAASPDGTLNYIDTDHEKTSSFFLVSTEDLDLLEDLKQHQWLVKSTRVLLDKESITLGSGGILKVGSFEIPLAHNLPFDRSNYPFRLTVLVDGWRIEELFLYKPLIYFVAAKDENTLDQLYLCLESLSKIAEFDGQILIFTDRTSEQIHEKVPWFGTDRITVVQIAASDWVGFVAGKYCILEQALAYECQPIAYMDPDIIFNADLKPLLFEMAVAGRITAPVETFSKLSEKPSVGANLFLKDNVATGDTYGFNAGTLGIPNLRDHRHSLDLIRRVILNYLSINGRNAFRWVDQESANYVSYKIVHVDTNIISKYVRFPIERHVDKLGPLTGVAHFFGVRGEERGRRPAVMRKYLDLLESHYSTKRAANKFMQSSKR